MTVSTQEKSGIKFCQEGHCELVDILGTDRVDAEFKAVKDTAQKAPGG